MTGRHHPRHGPAHAISLPVLCVQCTGEGYSACRYRQVCLSLEHDWQAYGHAHAISLRVLVLEE